MEGGGRWRLITATFMCEMPTVENVEYVGLREITENPLYVPPPHEVQRQRIMTMSQRIASLQREIRNYFRFSVWSIVLAFILVVIVLVVVFVWLV